MISYFKRFAAPAVIALLTFLPSAAKAASVEYYTRVSFTSNALGGATVASSGTNQGAPVGVVANDQLVSGGANIRATGVYVPSQTLFSDGSTTIANFGAFLVTSPTQNITAFDNAGIRIDIFQVSTNPGGGGSAGSGQFVGSLDANLVITGDPGNLIHLSFTGNQVLYIPSAALGFPPTVIYSIKEQDIGPNMSGAFSIVGRTAAAPLPGVAVGGLWLLGGLGSVGGLKSLRRRFSFGAAV